MQYLLWRNGTRTYDLLCVRERKVLSTASTPYLWCLTLYYLPIFRGVLSTESIDSMGLLWRFNWFQRAEESKEAAHRI